MIKKEFLIAASLSALLLGGCFNSETGASQRAANGESESHAPAKHEAKAEKHEAKAEKAEAPAKEEAPAVEKKVEKAETPAKAEEPKKEEAPAAEEKAAAPTASATPDLGGCKGCHGANFEKKAMGKSKVVAEMSKADIATALKGYKAGTYGEAMKGLMKGQVASLDDAQMDAIAEAIGK